MTDAEYLSNLLTSMSSTPDITSTPTDALLSQFNQQPQFQVQDGDTVNNMRVLGIDTPESFMDSAKAQKLADSYGVPLEVQKQLGDRAKLRTQQLLQDPNNTTFTPDGDMIDSYGRLLVSNEPLSDKLLSEGYAAPSKRYDEKAQGLFRAAQEKKYNLGMSDEADYMEAIRQSNIEYHNPGLLGSVGKSVDAFQSGGIQTLGKMGDMVTDIMAWGADKLGADGAAKYLDKLGETWSDTKYADKMTGYDRREASFRQQEVLADFKKGDYTGAFLNALTVAPEMVAESLPMMFEMVFGIGGKAKVTGEALKGVGNYLKRNAGFAAVVGQETNKQAEDFEKQSGRKATGVELAEMAGVNLVTLGLDRLAFKEIVGMKHELSAITAHLPEATRKGLMGTVLNTTGKMAKGTVLEGAQEYVQTWGEILNVNVDKSWSENLSNQQLQDEAVIGGIMGAAGGTVMSGTMAPIDSMVAGKRAKDKVQATEATNAPLSPEATLAVNEKFNTLITTQSPETEALAADFTAVLANQELDPDTKRTQLHEVLTAHIPDLQSNQADAIINTWTQSAAKVNSEESVSTEPIEASIPTESVDTIPEVLKPAEEVSSAQEPVTTEVAKPTFTPLEDNSGVVYKDLNNEEFTFKGTSNKYAVYKGTEFIGETTKGKKDAVRIANEYKPTATETSTIDDEIPSGLKFQQEKFKSNPNLPISIVANDDKVVSSGGKKEKRTETIDEDFFSKIMDVGITEDDLQELLANPEDTKLRQRAGKQFANGHKSQSELKDVRQTVSKNMDKAKELFKDIVNFDGSPEQAQAQIERLVILGMSRVLGGMQSTKNEALNTGNDIEPDIASISSFRTQIGKDHYNSYGAKLKGQDKDILPEYDKIGDAALDFLAHIGFIEMGKDKAVPIPENMFVESNERVSKFMRKKDVPAGVNIDPDTGMMIAKAAKVNRDMFLDAKDKKTETAKAITRLASLLLPGNYQLPALPGEGKVIIDNNRSINKEQFEILSNLAKTTFSIKGGFIGLLKEIRDYVDNKASQGISYDKAVENSKFLRNLLHTKNDLIEAYEESIDGYNRNRADSLRNLLDVLEDIVGEEGLNNSFSFDYSMASNQRIHVMNNLLDFQGDKFLARPITTGGEYTTGNKAEAAILINSLAEDMSSKKNPVTGSDIINGTTPFEKHLALLKDAKGLSILAVGKILDGSQKQPFEYLSRLQAILDVRAAYESNQPTKITTEYMPGFDATSSGVVITLMNLAGDSRVQALLKMLNISVDGVANENSMDPYGLLENFIKDPESFVKLGAVSKEAYESFLLDSGIGIEQLRSNVQELIDNDVFNNEREMSKYPIIRATYGEAAHNTVSGMSKSIVLELLKSAVYGKNKYAQDKIAEILESKEAVNLEKLTPKQLKKLEDYYANNIATDYVNGYNAVFTPIVEYRQKVKTIYGALEQTGQWDGTIRAPFQALAGDTNPKHNMSVTKERNIVQYTTDGGVVTTTPKAMHNETSLSVNLQHGSDSAQETRAIAEVVEEDNNGIMTIHDNVMATPKQLIKVKPAYEQGNIDIAIQYDFINEMLNELNRAILAMVEENTKAGNKEDSSLIKKLKKQLVELRAQNEPLISTKEDFLANVQTDLFGLNEDQMQELPTKVEPKKEAIDTIVEPEIKSEPNTKPEPKTEAKPSKAVQYLTELRKLVEEISNPFIDEKVTKVSRAKLGEVLESLKDMTNKPEYKALVDKMVTLFEDGKYEIFMSEMGNQFYALTGEVYISNSTGKIPKDTRYGTSKNLNIEGIIITLAHEVDHAINNSYIEQNFEKDSALKYLYKNVVGAITSALLKTITDKNLAGRMEYLSYEYHLKDQILENSKRPLKDRWKQAKVNRVAQIQATKELISVIRNEPDFAEDILNTLYPKDKGKYNSIKEALNRFWNMVVKWFNNTPNAFDNVEVNMTNTIHAIELVQFKAVTNPTNPTVGVAEQPSFLNFNAPVHGAMSVYEQANDAVNSYAKDFLRAVYDLAADAAGPTLKAAHDKAMAEYPIYSGTIKQIRASFYDSDFANKFRASLGLKENYSKKKMNDLNQAAYRMMQESKTLLTDNLTKLNDSMKSIYKPAELKVINDIFAKTGIANILGTDLYDDLLNGKVTLAQAITDAKKGLTTEQLNDVAGMVNYFVDGKVYSNKANLESFGHGSLNTLVALEALNRIPDSIQILSDMKTKHHGVYVDLIQLSMSIKQQKEIINDSISHDALGKIATSTFKYHDYDGHTIHDVYDETYDYKIVTDKDMRTDKYTTNNNWIMVRQPTATTFGIVARKTYHSGFVDGTGLNINRFANGIPTDKDLTTQLNASTATAVANNAIKTDGGNYRIILTTEEKAKLEYKNNPAESLMRTYVHNKEVIEADAVRNMVLKEFVKDMNHIDLKALADQIAAKKADNVDLPMFIKVDAYKSFDSLEQVIQDNYATPEGLSTFGGFNENITLVRKDFAHILLGYENVQLFGDSDSVILRRSEDVFRKGIAMFKMKLAVANPIKLSKDIVSNMTYLMTSGVGLTDIYDFGNEGYDAYVGLSKLRGRLINAKMKFAMTKDPRLEKHIVKIEGLIKANKFYIGEQYGFVQSYSTDLVTKDFDVISGLQADLDKLINSIIKTDGGDLNGIGEAIEWWSNFGASKGFTINALLDNAVRLSGTNKTSVGKEIINIANRLKKHKDNQQLDRYVGEILASPASEIVRVGSAVMVSTDAISKYIYANYLLKKVNPNTSLPYTEEEAYLRANESFIDYRINMPREIKALSDFGILMFPGYWMRIQRTIYRMAAENPVNAVISATSSHVTGLQGTNIIDSNVIEKVLDGRVFNATNPLDAFLY